jgi:alanine dehydrogenase
VGSAITNADYIAEGAEIAPDAKSVWDAAEMIMKVKEPLPSEYPLMKQGQILYTYLHLAASKECTDALIKAENVAIAYETVEVNGQLPLLAPMSEVAGRLSTQVGATALQKPNGGRGVLAWRVLVRPGKVVVIGGGVAGLKCCSHGSWLRCRCNYSGSQHRSSAIH